MRLVCPNCGARYEVPKENIFATGRDVKCSACDTTWFQTHPDAMAAPDASFGESYDDHTQPSKAVSAEFSAKSINGEAGNPTSNDDSSLSESAVEGRNTSKDYCSDTCWRVVTCMCMYGINVSVCQYVYV
mgnify:CR=1 FL=1